MTFSQPVKVEVAVDPSLHSHLTVSLDVTEAKIKKNGGDSRCRADYKANPASCAPLSSVSRAAAITSRPRPAIGRSDRL